MVTETPEQAPEVPAEPARRTGGLRSRADSLLAKTELLVAPFRAPPPVPTPYEHRGPEARRRLFTCTATGSIGSALILLGASLPVSPFTEKVPPPYVAGGSYIPPWFFGGTLEPTPITSGPYHLTHPAPGSTFYLSLVAFYGGLILLMGAWIRLGRLAREYPDLPVKTLALVMAAWTLPILFVEPLLSKDAFSYVAQGEMMSRGISPYKYVPYVLGGGANSYTILSDKLWWYSISPYGPAFLGLAGLIQTVVGHSELGALVLWRVVAVVGVGMIGVYTPRLARSFGRDVAPCFVFGVMNPIVIIHLIGGEHNDALMLGFLVAGLALARERHPVWGSVLVACGGLVKAPALIGIVYIGWDWLGTSASLRQRLVSIVKAGLVALAVMAAVTQAVGIGWGWVRGLTNPDAVVSYLDPVTALGLGLGKLAAALGHGGVAHLLLSVARGAGAVAAGAIGVVLLWRSQGGASSLRALGLTMLAVVLLGPVLQPWYLAWGLVLLAPVATGRLRALLIWLTVVETMLALGDAQYFVTQLVVANPFIVAAASVAMLALLLAPVAPKLRRGVTALREQRLLRSEAAR
jgi:alpha-1,6-mannosyltransferase